MKTIPLRKDANYSTIAVLNQVLGVSPVNQLSVEQMRKRVKALDVVEGIKNGATEITVEDDIHETIKMAVEGFPWSVAHKALLRVIDDVLEAKTPE